MAQYAVDREEFIKLLTDRPALVKTVVGLDEQTATDAVKKNHRVYDFLPLEFKTIKVSMAFLDREHIWSSGRPSEVPLEIRNQFPTPFLKKYLKEGSQFAKDFPTMPYECWLIAVKNGFDEVDKIPEQHVTEELLLEVFKYKKTKESGIDDRDFNIPDKFWTPKVCRLAVQTYFGLLRKIPGSLVTTELLSLAIYAPDSGISLKDLEIPASSWTPELAEKAVLVDSQNIRCVPGNLITKTMCLEAVRHGMDIEDMPVKDRDVKVTYLGHAYCHSYRLEEENKRTKKAIGKELNDVQFQIDVVREGGVDGLDNLNRLDANILPDTWVEFLKADPNVIQRIEKLQQTDVFIDTFLKTADADTIDKNAKYINLSKIHKEHVAILVGCKDEIILSCINKKMKGPQKRGPAPTEVQPILQTPSGSTVTLDMAPGDYAQIQTRLKK